MGIFRLNHVVLHVSDLDPSVLFYTGTLGFRRVDMTPEGFAGAAFLQAPDSTNDHDLGLFEIGALDLAAEKARYGTTTRGGVGISHSSARQGLCRHARARSTGSSARARTPATIR